MFPRLLYVVIFDVARARNNCWLRNIVPCVEITNSFRSLVSIENRHAKVHDNKSIYMLTLGVAVSNKCQRFFAIKCPVYNTIKHIKANLPEQKLQS